ncbi:MAG: ATP synthase subunit I [Steroidobacteraceae bacterium]
MSDSARIGKRRVVRFVMLQLACVVIAAIVASAWAGWNAGRSAFVGGVIIASGTAIFGWMLFSEGATSSPGVTRALYAGELLKWVWVVGAFWLAFAYGDFQPLALIVGAMVAQVGFWIGIGFLR